MHSNSKRNLGAWLAASFLAAGASACGEDDDSVVIDEPHIADLTATERLDYRGVDGHAMSVPVDLRRAIVAALTPRDDGGWDVWPGVGGDDGRLVVPDVPEGEHWLRVDRYQEDPEALSRDEYLWTDEVEVDYSVARIGRPDVSYAETTTPLVVDADGLTAWRAGSDELAYYAPNLELINFNNRTYEGIVDNFPGEGDTALAGLTYEFAALHMPLAEAARGDRISLQQWRIQENLQGSLFAAPINHFVPAAFTQVDGQSTRLSGSFETGEPFRYRLAWDRPAFEALRSDVHPSLAGPSLYHELRVEASPGAAPEQGEWRWGTQPVQVLVIDPALVEGAGPLDAGELSADLVYPEDHIYTFHEVGFPVTPPVPGETIGRPLLARIGQYDRPHAGPVVPLLAPPRAPTVNGDDALSPLVGVGTTPTLAWQPPAMGSVNHYRITLALPGAGDLDLGGLWVGVAQLVVPGDVTSVRVPADVLWADVPYVAIIRAVSQPDIDVRVTPNRRALPYAYADAVTATFTP